MDLGDRTGLAKGQVPPLLDLVTDSAAAGSVDAERGHDMELIALHRVRGCDQPSRERFSWECF
jgi:hypothetical protein